MGATAWRNRLHVFGGKIAANLFRYLAHRWRGHKLHQALLLFDGKFLFALNMG
jgi:hypothetical protein